MSTTTTTAAPTTTTTTTTTTTAGAIDQQMLLIEGMTSPANDSPACLCQPRTLRRWRGQSSRHHAGRWQRDIYGCARWHSIADPM
jgi:hypothetical protein